MRGLKSPSTNLKLTADGKGATSCWLEGSAPSNPWLSVVKKVDSMRKRDNEGAQRSLTISGPEYFGLSSPLVMYLMSKMEGADKLEKFLKRPVKVESEEPEEKSDPDDVVSPAPMKPLRHSSRIRQKLELVIDLSQAAQKYTRLAAPEIVWRTDDVLQRDSLDVPFGFEGDSPLGAIRKMMSRL